MSITTKLLRIFTKNASQKEPVEYIKKMRGYAYIKASRDYLDYLEEHLSNVAKAFNELSCACDGKESWVGDDFSWFTLKAEVEAHDLSKLTMHEFTQYRDHFFPTCKEDKENSGFGDAWEHHKQENHHHHETAEHFGDITHMIIDWVSMSYKFKDNPRDFYNKTKPSMKLTDAQHKYIDRIFKHLEDYRLNCNKSK